MQIKPFYETEKVNANIIITKSKEIILEFTINSRLSDVLLYTLITSK